MLLKIHFEIYRKKTRKKMKIYLLINFFTVNYKMLKNSCTILFFAFLLLIQSSVSETDNRKNVDQGFDEEETLDL